jgi:DnaJ-class molecular chaperone
MNNHENLYQALGVSKTASHDEIKKAYRKLSMELHPDRNNGSQESTEKFQKIAAAYDILGDESKRQQYDMQGRFQFSSNNGPHGQGGFNPFSGMGINPNDLFNFFTGNMHPGAGGVGPGANGAGHPHMQFFTMDQLNRNMNKPMPIIKNIELTMSKTYTDSNVPVEITRWIVENGMKREENETLYVAIPKGIDNNEMIILREKGNILNENNKGDVKIFIKVTNDTEFTRNGLDLVLHKIISLKEALCGFEFDMKHIDGKVFKVNNGNGSVIGFNHKKVISGLGMKRDSHTGNLIIDFTVSFPEKLSEKQVEHLSKIL